MDSSNLRTEKKITCPTCGQQYDARAKFCGVDGTDLTSLGNKKTEFTKICTVCKNVYPHYAEYCPTDAKKLTDVNSEPKNQSAAAMPATSATPESKAAEPEKNKLASLEGEAFIGQIIAGKYKIEKLLGEGGMAQVYRATHIGIEKTVVIKIMFGNLPSMKNSLARFEQECKLTAKLNHPNLVSVFDSGRLGEQRPFLVMEYIEGESLRDRMLKQGNFPVQAATQIMAQICSGLTEAHNKGIVHRDLKPENVMLRKEADRPDWVKVVDFGIAYLKQGGPKLTATGVAVGTVDYMSPEYLNDKPVDHRSDIYALGIILHELITGRCPFEAENAEAVMAKHLFSTAPPVSKLCKTLKPGGLMDQIVQKSLDKDPINRYQSTAAMKFDLEKMLKELA